METLPVKGHFLSMYVLNSFWVLKQGQKVVTSPDFAFWSETLPTNMHLFWNAFSVCSTMLFYFVFSYVAIRARCFVSIPTLLGGGERVQRACIECGALPLVMMFSVNVLPSKNIFCAINKAQYWI